MKTIPKSTSDKILRLALRTIPLLPGPELFDLLRDLTQSKKSVNDKIDKAHSSLKETSMLIQDLQDELADRTSKVEELRSTYERYAQLAEIEEEKVRPLMEQLEIALAKDRRKQIWIGILINFTVGVFIFILGIVLSPAVKRWLGF